VPFQICQDQVEDKRYDMRGVIQSVTCARFVPNLCHISTTTYGNRQKIQQWLEGYGDEVLWISQNPKTSRFNTVLRLHQKPFGYAQDAEFSNASRHRLLLRSAAELAWAVCETCGHSRGPRQSIKWFRFVKHVVSSVNACAIFVPTLIVSSIPSRMVCNNKMAILTLTDPEFISRDSIHPYHIIIVSVFTVIVHPHFD
jgi:hypothetical protein